MFLPDSPSPGKDQLPCRFLPDCLSPTRVSIVFFRAFMALQRVSMNMGILARFGFLLYMVGFGEMQCTCLSRIRVQIYIRMGNLIAVELVG